MNGISNPSAGLPDSAPALAMEFRYENAGAQLISLPPSEWFMSAYTQNGEDLLPIRVHRDVTNDLHVDIGAYEPETGSVAKAFYERGWPGINIEPGPLFSKLAEARPRGINLRLAVRDDSGRFLFCPHPVSLGLSRVAPSPAGGEPGRDSCAVPRETFENILAARAHIRQPQFIKIDAEGAESAMINSTNWRIVRPLVLVFRATLPMAKRLVNEAWEKHLS
jgi:FkbM family methyltransferase